MTSQYTIEQQRFMARAIQLAKRGKYTTSPNPCVGCVIVKNGEIVGEGFHVTAGKAHAEVHALNQAGKLAKGAEVYVTLEPCSHFGRTPPCALALIKAEVSHVYCAMEDPNPHVAGQGFELLVEAGIKVSTGLLAEDAANVNQGYIKRITTGKPYVKCKLASSLDGKTAMANGESKWITSSQSRQDVQRLRAVSCAVVTSAVSVIRDNARMNVRADELNLQSCATAYPANDIRQPLRVIIDSKNRLTPDLLLFSQPTPVLILRTNLESEHEWPHFVEQLEVSKVQHSGSVCLQSVIKLLADRGLNEILIEAGNQLVGAFIEQGLVDELVLYLAPKLMGAEAMNLVAMPSIKQLADSVSLDIKDVRQIGSDIRINAKINEK